MKKGALSDLKVLEIADGVSGPYCGKLFAGMGAEVIKIENPKQGDKTRQWGPFTKKRPHLEQSGFFLYLNTGKKSLTLNLEDSRGRNIFRELVQGTDVLIANHRPDELKRIQLEYGILKALNPRLTMVSILPFGYTGRHCNWKGGELIAWMAGGLGYYVPTLVQEPQAEPPIKLPGHNIEINSAFVAAAAVMLALFLRKGRGEGQFIDISMQDVVANMAKMEIVGITYNALKPTRLYKDTLLPLTAERVKDGYVYFMYFTENSHWEATRKLMDDPPWAQDERFSTLFGRLENIQEIRAGVNAWLIRQGKWDIAQKAQKLGIPCSPLLTVKEAFEHEQAQERNFFTQIEHPVAGNFKYPGSIGWFSKSPVQHQPAPLLGQHNEETYGARLGYNLEQIQQLRLAGVI